MTMEKTAASPRMSVMGIGLKAGAVVGGALVLTAAISLLYPDAFRITRSYGALLVAGIALAVIGFSLNLMAAFQMLKAHREDRLAAGWAYRVFLNPMYFFMVFVTLPGITLLFNSWLVLAVIPIGAVAVHLLAKEEARYLEAAYGEAYRAYRRSVKVRF
jgi:protein-S-isoprenylcysteine O-methyltransferase Ste14